jgi:hypothetical protein
MFCTPGLVFDGTEGVWSSFDVLLSRTRFRRYGGHQVPFSCFARPTHFWRYRGRRVPFSCFVRPNSFSAVPTASGPILMFCAPGHVFDDPEGVGRSFHILPSRTHFRRFRGRRVPFLCFASSYSFSAVPRASGPIFMFCDPGHVFDGTQGGRSRFYVLRARTRFRLYRGRQLPFSCFARPNSFSALSTASDPVFMFSLPDTFSALWKVLGLVFMFCAPGLIFDGTVGVGARFHVLHARTRFQRYRRRQVPFSCFRSWTCFRWCGGHWYPFSCFSLPDSFSTVPRTSGPVFMFCAPELIFGGTDNVRSHFHVLRSRTRFRRCEGRWVLFSYFSLPNSFSAVPRASGPVFIIFAHRLIFGGTEGVGFRFHVLRGRTRICRYRRRQLPLSCFELPDTFLAVRRALGSVFMFCAPVFIFGGSEGVGSRFHVLRPRTRFRRYRGRRVPFTFIVLPNSFPEVPMASGPVFMFCSPRLVFGGNDGVGSYFHVLRSRTLFRR